MTAVYIQPIGYGRFCRLLTIGISRHATACRASIPADEPVLITAQRPADSELCSACRMDLQPREARRENLTPWHREIGVRAELTVERAAEELFGTAERLDVQTAPPRGPYLETFPDPSTGEPLIRRVGPAPAISRTVTPDLRRPAVELDVETLFADDRVSAFDVEVP